MKENIINDWLLKNQNPEIEKQVEIEAEQIIQNQQLSQTTVRRFCGLEKQNNYERRIY